jgi:hypothetical protein
MWLPIGIPNLSGKHSPWIPTAHTFSWVQYDGPDIPSHAVGLFILGWFSERKKRNRKSNAHYYPFGIFKLFFDQRIRKQANKFINRSVSKILHTLKIFLWNKRYSTRILNRCLLWRSEFRCSWKVCNSCSTSDTRRITLVTNPLKSHEWGKDRGMITTNGTYRGHLWHGYFNIVHWSNMMHIILLNKILQYDHTLFWLSWSHHFNSKVLRSPPWLG